MIKDVEIVAKDKNGNELGKTTADKPETFQEILDNFDEKEVVTLFWGAFVIKEQARLRGAKKELDTVKAFKKLTPEQQAQLLELANKRVNVIE